MLMRVIRWAEELSPTTAYLGAVTGDRLEKLRAEGNEDGGIAEKVAITALFVAGAITISTIIIQKVSNSASGISMP